MGRFGKNFNRDVRKFFQMFDKLKDGGGGVPVLVIIATKSKKNANKGAKRGHIFFIISGFVSGTPNCPTRSYNLLKKEIYQK